MLTHHPLQQQGDGDHTDCLWLSAKEVGHIAHDAEVSVQTTEVATANTCCLTLCLHVAHRRNQCMQLERARTS